ncbi:hypothetical protein SLA2020_102360 [Shorea laevis]
MIFTMWMLPLALVLLIHPTLKRYYHAKIGTTTAFELEKSCRVELMILCSSTGMSDSNITYLDVPYQLSCGLELQWFPYPSIWIGTYRTHVAC